jgi:aryl-alcohol dehydrogenase-like predicted oxidoreductase
MGAALGAALPALAKGEMPITTLGKSGLKVSRFTLGGAHMRRGTEENAVRIIRRAHELGVTFFDSAHLYNKGESDAAYGKAFSKSMRSQVLLMGKAHLYTYKEAMQQLEDTLRRMNTDYLDLWQCHQVCTHQEVDRILGPGGSLEAFVKAKQQGKVRHIGYTGHRDPTVHKRLLESFDGWETVQHPVNLVDPHHKSFIKTFLPLARKKGLGVIAMKTNAGGGIGKNSIATVEECLRFALSQDVDTVVSGVETVEQLEQNVAVIKSGGRMTAAAISALLARTAKGPTGEGVESYKRVPPGSAGARQYRDGEPV